MANPPAGKWTALFFTEQNGATKGGKGTKGAVQWDASTWQYEPAGSISPSSLTIGPGQTATRHAHLTNPGACRATPTSPSSSPPRPGRPRCRSPSGPLVPMGTKGGIFKGVLTGGNGRDGSDAQTNTYFFTVPPGETDLDASVALPATPVRPWSATWSTRTARRVGYSSNYTVVPSAESGLPPGARATPLPVRLYHLAPAGRPVGAGAGVGKPGDGQRAHRAVLRRRPVQPGAGQRRDLPTSLRRPLLQGQTADLSSRRGQHRGGPRGLSSSTPGWTRPRPSR